MSIELRGPVVDFLGMISVNWPQVNEDAVHEFAGHMCEFSSNLQDTHGGLGQPETDLADLARASAD